MLHARASTMDLMLLCDSLWGSKVGYENINPPLTGVSKTFLTIQRVTLHPNPSTLSQPLTKKK